MNEQQKSSMQTVLQALSLGGIIAYPTEAVFGLGCDPDSGSAVEALLALKQRPKDKGLILIADSYAKLLPYIDDAQLSVERREQIFACWPGPVTWVMPARKITPQWLTGRFKSLAVRVSDHPLVKELCRHYGKALVSTSANLSAQLPSRTAEDVRQQFGQSFPVLEGKVGGRQYPSEIRDAATGQLIRHG